MNKFKSIEIFVQWLLANADKAYTPAKPIMNTSSSDAAETAAQKAGFEAAPQDNAANRDEGKSATPPWHPRTSWIAAPKIRYYWKRTPYGQVNGTRFLYFRRKEVQNCSFVSRFDDLAEF